MIKSIIQESVRDVLENESYYENLNEHTESSKCKTALIRDDYKKGSSNCEGCDCVYMENWISGKQDSASKQDSSSN